MLTGSPGCGNMSSMEEEEFEDPFTSLAEITEAVRMQHGVKSPLRGHVEVSACGVADQGGGSGKVHFKEARDNRRTPEPEGAMWNRT